MTVTERAAYVRGLFEGLDFGENKKEGKILTAIIDLLDDMAMSIEELEDENDALEEVIDTLVEDLYDDYDDDDLEDGDDLDFDPEEDLFQAICPSCGEEIVIDEDSLALGSIKCPACGESLEFDLSGLEDDAPEYPEDTL